MSTEKESYEASPPPQKANPFPPSLTNNKNSNSNKKVKPTAAGCDPNGDSFGGYYQNVTQKGKLILPTAIWILIVIGGLCFLSLLSSLNSTISTLDTLIEIEQANARLNDHMHDDHHHNHIRQDRYTDHQQQQQQQSQPALGRPHRRARLVNQNSNSDLLQPSIQPVDPLMVVSSEPKLASSWPSFPPWASLEPLAHRHPTRREQQQEQEQAAQKSLFSSFFSPSNPLAIESNSPLPMSGGGIIIASTSSSSMPADSQLDSIIGQMIGGGLGKQVMGRGEESSKAPVQPQSLITANIDKLNININTAENKPTQVDSEQARKEPLEPMLSSLLSLDSLVPVNEPVFVPLPPFEPSRRGDSNNHHRHQHQHKSHRHSSAGHGRNHLHRSSHSHVIPLEPITPAVDFDIIPHMFGKPNMPSLSPYEMIYGGESSRTNQPKKHQGLVNEMDSQQRAEEALINSLAQSFFENAQENQKEQHSASSTGKNKNSNSNSNNKGNSNSNDDGFESIIFINGEPLIGDAKQSLSMNEDPTKKMDEQQDNRIKDLFSVLLQLPPPMTPTTATPQVSAEPTQANDRLSFKSDSTEIPAIPEPRFALGLDELANSSSDNNKTVKTTERPSEDSEGQKDLEQLVDTLMGSMTTMFSVPQFGDERPSMFVEAQSSGNKQATPVSATTPTPSKNCTKPTTTAKPLATGAQSSKASSSKPTAPSAKGSDSGSDKAGGKAAPATSKAPAAGKAPAASSDKSAAKPPAAGGGSTTSKPASGASSPAKKLAATTAAPKAAGSSGGAATASKAPAAKATTSGPAKPAGFVAMPGNSRRGAVPSGPVLAGQESGASPPKMLPPCPPASHRPHLFGRFGEFIASLGNSTAGFFPRFRQSALLDSFPCDSSVPPSPKPSPTPPANPAPPPTTPQTISAPSTSPQPPPPPPPPPSQPPASTAAPLSTPSSSEASKPASESAATTPKSTQAPSVNQSTTSSSITELTYEIDGHKVASKETLNTTSGTGELPATTLEKVTTVGGIEVDAGSAPSVTTTKPTTPMNTLETTTATTITTTSLPEVKSTTVNNLDVHLSPHPIWSVGDIATATSDVAATTSPPSDFSNVEINNRVVGADVTRANSNIDRANQTTRLPAVTTTTPETTTATPFKTFMQKADDFIGRNIMSIKRFLTKNPEPKK